MADGGDVRRFLHLGSAAAKVVPQRGEFFPGLVEYTRRDVLVCLVTWLILLVFVPGVGGGRGEVKAA